MSAFLATIIVAIRYIICSKTQEGGYGEAGSIRGPPRPRLAHRAADHGAARHSRPTLEPPNSLGIARRAPHLARPAHGLRRGFPDGASGAANGTAPGGGLGAW